MRRTRANAANVSNEDASNLESQKLNSKQSPGDVIDLTVLARPPKRKRLYVTQPQPVVVESDDDDASSSSTDAIPARSSSLSSSSSTARCAISSLSSLSFNVEGKPPAQLSYDKMKEIL